MRNSIEAPASEKTISRIGLIDRVRNERITLERKLKAEVTFNYDNETKRERIRKLLLAVQKSTNLLNGRRATLKRELRSTPDNPSVITLPKKVFPAQVEIPAGFKRGKRRVNSTEHQVNPDQVRNLTAQVIALAGEGKSPQDIASEMDLDLVRVTSAIRAANLHKARQEKDKADRVAYLNRIKKEKEKAKVKSTRRRK